MGIPISIIFLFASLIVFWIIPAIGIAKSHLVDDRFFIRQWLFPIKSWQNIQNQIKLPLGKRYARLRLI